MYKRQNCISSGINQCLCSSTGCNVSGDNLQIRVFCLDLLYGFQNVFGMTVCGIDNDDIDMGSNPVSYTHLDGKYVSSAAHAGDISHPALITGKQRQDTDLLTPQWLYYQSDGSVTDRNIKKEMDVLMRKWTKGKLGGKELDRLIKEFLQKKDCPVRQITMQEKAVCVFPSEKELPDLSLIHI